MVDLLLVKFESEVDTSEILMIVPGDYNHDRVHSIAAEVIEAPMLTGWAIIQEISPVDGYLLPDQFDRYRPYVG